MGGWADRSILRGPSSAPDARFLPSRETLVKVGRPWTPERGRPLIRYRYGLPKPDPAVRCHGAQGFGLCQRHEADGRLELGARRVLGDEGCDPHGRRPGRCGGVGVHRVDGRATGGDVALDPG